MLWSVRMFVPEIKWKTKCILVFTSQQAYLCALCKYYTFVFFSHKMYLLGVRKIGHECSCLLPLLTGKLFVHLLFTAPDWIYSCKLFGQCFAHWSAQCNPSTCSPGKYCSGRWSRRKYGGWHQTTGPLTSPRGKWLTIMEKPTLLEGLSFIILFCLCFILVPPRSSSSSSSASLQSLFAQAENEIFIEPFYSKRQLSASSQSFGILLPAIKGCYKIAYFLPLS